MIIQDDSGEKFNIVECDTIGHCEKKFTWTCVKFWMVTEIELFESTHIKALRMVIKKEKLLTVNFIFI